MSIVADERTESRFDLRQHHRSWQQVLLDNGQSSVYALGQLYRAPRASLLIALVIAIALLLPALGSILLHNSTRLIAGLSSSSAISLFLHHTVEETDAIKLAAQLRTWDNIAAVTSINKAEGLREFEDHAEIGDVLALLAENPLPHVLVVEPISGVDGGEPLQQLINRLQSLPQTEVSRFDSQWVQRLSAWIELLRRIAIAISVLMMLGVMVIVGNTIKMCIDQRHRDIEILRLIGATNAFIRRPFLYIGLWYGLCGSILALLLLWLLLNITSTARASLVAAYGNGFDLIGLDFWMVSILIIAGPLLGLIGSWVLVSQYLWGTSKNRA